MPMREWYTVHEIFSSIQGEGVLTGVPSTFIRLQGCPVHCWWCDSGPLADEELGPRTTNGETRNTWGAGGKRMTLAEILNEVKHRHVIITGGEPLIWDLDSLIYNLKYNGARVQLETSGYKGFIGKKRPDWVTWSPKENLEWEAPSEFKLLANEVKYVVDENFDIKTALKQFHWFKARDMKMPEFVLMPEGMPPKLSNIQRTIEMLDGLDSYIRLHFRFGDRLQYRLGLR